MISHRAGAVEPPREGQAAGVRAVLDFNAVVETASRVVRTEAVVDREQCRR